MTAIDYGALRPAPLPADARALMRFLWHQQLCVDTLGWLARHTPLWRYPQDLLLEMDSTYFWSYWIHKTGNPITRAMRDSRLEQHFASARQAPPDLFPAGFEAEHRASMSAVGDLIATKGLEHSRDSLYTDIADLVFDADIRYANFESTLSRTAPKDTLIQPGETPEINVTPEQYEAFIGHQGRHYSMLQLANNHILDCGQAGIDVTLERLERDGIDWVGINPEESDAAQGRIIEVNGIRIGWVAFTFSVNFRPFPEGKDYLVNFVPFHLERNPDTAAITRQIRWCREQNCDVVILGLHWGLEFEIYPHPEQLQWAREFAEAGADLIVCHHPHVVQPIEYYRTRRDPARHVPIIYSLGNLMPLIHHPASVLSAVARLELVKGKVAGRSMTLPGVVSMTPVALLAERHDGEGLRLARLSSLVQAELSPAMRDYTQAVEGFAHLALGDSWREPDSVCPATIPAAS
ncbi:CapA family protein [Pseudohalioglobus sediminis]|uniref:CapA family protein n=1 Tax=Pseudohalioglobus sediminis TaxID=2606449 RepID=A0A5B0X442_9GAMM|nr:CapA family protein [Pseudohalioglobus sediminis]KAA1194130.1 CapA family protein [Pseudohalioglobus sediminis]